ncbi:MAG: TetR/AcrR family transcriptional regulator [Lachnospiraceae bacterium]|nr:TetR/AcrR family transcriptional regulator [Lachnospiraceae bacterium]
MVTITEVTEWLPTERNIIAGDTKERIWETALELFAQNGYLGTSVNDIAKQLGFTKAALYKHYTSKQEILDRIVERMNEMDYERAESYEMPETEPDGLDKTIQHTIDGSCAPGLFPLVSVPTIVGCIGALLIIIAAIATPIAKTQKMREAWFYVMSGGAVLKIVTMEIARIIF